MIFMSSSGSERSSEPSERGAGGELAKGTLRASRLIDVGGGNGLKI